MYYVTLTNIQSRHMLAPATTQFMAEKEKKTAHKQTDTVTVSSYKTFLPAEIR